MKPVNPQKTDILVALAAHEGQAGVQLIRENLVARAGTEIQYLEMKQMADVLTRFRGRVRLVLSQYRVWKAAYAVETDDIEKVYMAYEGIFIRRQFADVWQLYVTVNRDYHDMRRVYLANLRHPPHRRVA